MCNLYSVMTNQQAIRDFANAVYYRLGNMPPLPGVFPDYPAPILASVLATPHRIATIAIRLKV